MVGMVKPAATESRLVMLQLEPKRTKESKKNRKGSADGEEPINLWVAACDGFFSHGSMFRLGRAL